MRRLPVHGSQRLRAERHTRWHRRAASTTWRTAPAEAGKGRVRIASRGLIGARSSDGDLVVLMPPTTREAPWPASPMQGYLFASGPQIGDPTPRSVLRPLAQQRLLPPISARSRRCQSPVAPTSPRDRVSAKLGDVYDPHLKRIRDCRTAPRGPDTRRGNSHHHRIRRELTGRLVWSYRRSVE
jgi:hypothetical protein